MPKPDEFLVGFDLVKDSVYADYKLKKILISHDTVKKYHEYRYSIKLIFVKMYEDSSANTLYKELDVALSNTVVIYGRRNPYLCSVDILKFRENMRSVTVTLEGHAIKMPHK